MKSLLFSFLILLATSVQAGGSFDTTSSKWNTMQDNTVAEVIDEPYLVEYEDITYQVWENLGYAEVLKSNPQASGVILDSVTYDGKQYPVTAICDEALSGTSFTEIRIPETITNLGRGAFRKCKNLIKVVMPQGITEIPEHCFFDCRKLNSITLPENLLRIGEEAFCCCSSLEEINFPPTIEEIGIGAFTACDLHEITLPASLVTIGDGAFSDCHGLTKVYGGESLTHIGNGAFSYCKHLNEMTFYPSLTSIGYNAFNKCAFSNVVLPPSINQLGNMVFGNCEYLLSASLPQGLTKLPNGFFRDCWRLKSVELPSSIQELGDNCFFGCYSLDSIWLKDAVVEIGEKCFSECPLTYLRCDAVTPPSATLSSFYKVNKKDCAVWVPEESLLNYQAADAWRDFELWNGQRVEHEPAPYLVYFCDNWYGEYINFYLAKTNIGTTDPKGVGTRFESITNAEVAALYGEGWRLPSVREAEYLLREHFDKVMYEYFPSTYRETNSGTEFTSNIIAGEYWIADNKVMIWAKHWGTRIDYDEQAITTTPWYDTTFPVRPVRDTPYLGITELQAEPQTNCVYDLTGRRNPSANGICIEVMSDGCVRKTIIK